MTFRYKVKLNSSGYNYFDVIIQKYNENAHIFRWKTVADTTLCKMVCELHPELYENNEFSYDINSASLYNMLMQYKNMGDFVKKYIVDILFARWRFKNKIDDYRNQIAKFVLTDGWELVEIKEDKN